MADRPRIVERPADGEWLHDRRAQRRLLGPRQEALAGHVLQQPADGERLAHALSRLGEDAARDEQRELRHQASGAADYVGAEARGQGFRGCANGRTGL